jgi:hypothetical protein
MTVTLHPEPGESLPDLVRRLTALTAPGGFVRSGRGGVVVDADTARAYLCGPITTEPAAAVPAPQPAPAAAVVVTQAEDTGGPRQQPATNKPRTARRAKEQR